VEKIWGKGGGEAAAVEKGDLSSGDEIWIARGPTESSYVTGGGRWHGLVPFSSKTHSCLVLWAQVIHAQG
jgi:hypothetical protein